uniref:Class I SAM-dependent rRNA methyltransferase n=1 Tax=Mesoaciditoga lauensis TaxID=1495039 RepID=A0A7V3VSJ2_9BACT
MEIVKLKKRGFEKIERNHLWIFSDEIEEVLSDKGVGIANIFYDDKFVGRGLYNGNTKNSLKFLTYKDEEINLNFFRRRFEFAKLRRKQLSPFRREINSEGDLLPGLIVDRFDKTLVVQVRSVALESLKNIIVDALLESYDPESIYERSDFESLPEDGLSRSKGILYGSMPEIQTLEENGLKFAVDVVNGQKTGFFLDQRESRAFVRNFSGSKRALDLFTYTGGFALNMAATGMNVDGIDISESDLEIAKANATINDLDVNFIKKDAFDLTGLGIYDLVIADPPSLIKKKE